MVPPHRQRPVAGDPGIGHKISAIGSLHRPAVTDCSFGYPPRLFSFRGTFARALRHTRVTQVVPPAHLLVFRFFASPSHLVRDSSRHTPLDGKVRWQRKFAFPARRMKRGLQFLKKISSRRFTTNAKMNTPWRGLFTTAALHACCRACSRHLSTLAWS